MKLKLRHMKEKDLFELQLVEPHLRAHFLLNRKMLNELRALIERILIETKTRRER